jgi:hypothetical protein
MPHAAGTGALTPWHLSVMQDQRLEMYMVISKPRRTSIACGVCQVMVQLLQVNVVVGKTRSVTGCHVLIVTDY